ncbi:hypothetical protein FY036_13480 [Mesorhizobium microcysteis]|uniref:Uncharacterized protein n=1 Tax=Neoaquamicrobium microcysteis TaxID=2682781 RepID=A0A5D4GZV9_9HYPH|nr:hypothetical protein [Mesorhizobium microcysteis]TYR32090.1 hypothetical protein FY036_13480 [Mesorhizobium microcysteis]
METLWDTIQGVGAIVGLATGLFVLWDRVFRFSPTAIVVVRPLLPGGMPKGTYLQISNPSDRPIIVSWRAGMRPNEFSIAEDHQTRSIVAALLEGGRSTVIDPASHRELLLLKPSNVDVIDPDNTIECEIYWRYAQPKIWKRDRRLSVAISKRSMMILDPDDYGALD